jgi:protein-L-isoaspartate(D-aspartate) O-methyltransferase
MTQLLRLEPGMKVLEIGTGSGYQTAILVEMGAKVVTIERHEPLVDHAVEVLEKLGYADNIDFRVDDGTVGVPEDAPYDRIIVTAAGPEIPEALERQLAENGRMVIPVGIGNQKLVIVTRSGDKIVRIPDIGVIFVKLIGKEGFSE